MAVFTKLSKDEISIILSKYDLGEILDVQEIAEGVENTNYLIITHLDKYVLTLFEKRVSKKDIPFYISYMEHLRRAGLPVPEVIENLSSGRTFTHNAKTGIIISFLEGKALTQNITIEHANAFGQFVAKMHNLSASMHSKKDNDYDKSGCIKLFQDLVIRRGISGEDKALIEGIFENELGEFDHDLPKSIIHGDLFEDNVFFKGKEITGLIDFYFSCYDFMIYDLAIAINAWCFDNDCHFNKERALAMINGYNKVRTLTASERKSFRDFCLLAAVRFFITRSFDLFHQSNSDFFVKFKNPEDFKHRIKFFLKWQGIKR